MADAPTIAEPVSPYEMGSMKHDDLELLAAQRQEASARATLVNALSKLGRFDEALVLAGDAQKLVVQSHIDAENAPDDERCDCEHFRDEQDYVRFGENAKPKLVPVVNYRQSYRYWSRKYNQMCWKHRCVKCGHQNALPDDVTINSH